MKLRIRGNSIRFRLLKSEVAELAEKGSVSESTDFGDSRLTYSIVQGSGTSAGFANGAVTVTVSEEEIRAWADDDSKIGIEADSEGLKILIEKDFACPTRKDDPDNLDAFANPEAVCT
ncbi:MAG: hypothetical protein DWQ47_14395 [Acidobacteria bacterium]|nr:MAG: hypothetical protein DWQ32_01795 [Acidobacteriota bacterium]REK02742.1 MAG: hypothetical protein DWQ38_10340 [Acidobacteriota bacterium]REK13453.1 MAG: hypothetical protein DWQ43_07485 [Acidobacteriota bacterium]REK41447.1 MAG: hypothetical protein DWQ47_14395 [Acidobacteriota bacterium]